MAGPCLNVLVPSLTSVILKAEALKEAQIVWKIELSAAGNEKVDAL